MSYIATSSMSQSNTVYMTANSKHAHQYNILETR